MLVFRSGKSGVVANLSASAACREPFRDLKM